MINFNTCRISNFFKNTQVIDKNLLQLLLFLNYKTNLQNHVLKDCGMDFVFILFKLISMENYLHSWFSTELYKVWKFHFINTQYLSKSNTLPPPPQTLSTVCLQPCTAVGLYHTCNPKKNCWWLGIDGNLHCNPILAT